VKVTDRAPFSWHGWSPDGTTLVSCAERGTFDGSINSSAMVPAPR
jgi:hypothetical protein